jgi:hypothetical protein
MEADKHARPDAITFVALINAASRSTNVELARKYARKLIVSRPRHLRVASFNNILLLCFFTGDTFGNRERYVCFMASDSAYLRCGG